MKILFSGGGTGGSVTPLIALYQTLIKQNNSINFYWIGGKDGVEKNIVDRYNIKYFSVSSGKLRRYFSWHNFVDPFKIILGFFQSFMLLLKIKPQIIVVAGSYIAVPVAWSASLLRIPIIVHHQDIEAGLANKLMAPFADKISISWQESKKDFNSKKVIYTGNPIRSELLEKFDEDKFKEKYDLDELPVVLVVGGGTGSESINDAIALNLPSIVNICNIFHITGKGKGVDIDKDIENIKRYRRFEFVGDEIFDMMKIADLVITRAGMSTLSELAVLAKPTIIVPLSGTHQEKNANIFYENNASIVYDQKYLNSEEFVGYLKELLLNKTRLDSLSFNIKKMMPADATEKLSKIIIQMVNSKK